MEYGQYPPPACIQYGQPPPPQYSRHGQPPPPQYNQYGQPPPQVTQQATPVNVVVQQTGTVNYCTIIQNNYIVLLDSCSSKE